MFGACGRNAAARLLTITDFDIGEIEDCNVLARAGITVTGFTETIGPQTRTSYSGTRMYMAPELLAGKAPSTRSDIYSLGVVFYQLVIGDLSQPLATDWERGVHDRLLCEDLHGCLAGNPAERFFGAADVTRRLGSLEKRRSERRLRRIGLVAAVVLMILALVGGPTVLSQKRQLEREGTIREQAESQMYYSSIGFVTSLIEEKRYDVARQVLAACPERLRNWETSWP